MKKIYNILTASALSLCLLTACSNVLDTSPANNPSSEIMWTNENLTDMGVAGIYANLRNLCESTSNGNSAAVGFYGFDCYGTTGQMVRNTALTNAPNVGSGVFSNTWKRMYEGIHRANDAILNIPLKSPVSAEKKGRLVAESKFLRAFYYYMLNQLYKGVPYYDVPVVPADATKSQETEAFIWEKVIADLTDCINEPNFPDNSYKEGRASKGAAYALRGKAYMHTKAYDKAAADFAKVGECGYSLFQGGYKELFLEANEACSEMIFRVQNIAETGYGNQVQRFVGTNSATGGGTVHGWNDYMATPDVVDLYENADGTPFNWDDVIPGYSTMPAAKREVYFLRDTKKNGAEIHAQVTTAVEDRLKALEKTYSDIRIFYLEEGNEARIRAAYTNRDPRLEMNVITPYSTFKGWRNTPAEAFESTYRIPTAGTTREDRAVADFWPNNGNKTGGNSYYFHRKFVWEGFNTVQRDYGPTDEPIIRYADVLLAWAEALVEQPTPNLSLAAEKVNMVRGRSSVNMPNVVYTDKEDLLKKIKQERKREFVNEGVDFFDEMRWGTLKESKFYTGNGAKSVWGAIIGGTAYAWPSTGDLNIWPVPTAEVERNTNLVKTPGWTY